MWKVLLFTFLLHITYRSIETSEESTWSNNEFRLPQNLQITLEELIKQRLQPQKPNEQIQARYYHRKSEQKRAFSILARMKPFSDFGKQRTSIRQTNKNFVPLPPMSDLDIVSAETRAMFRPIGQPLRWG